MNEQHLKTNNIMKKYIANFTDTKGADWDLIINANSYKEALKDAREQQKEYGKLVSLRLKRD